MALRRIFDGGYTNYGLGDVHPNGTVFAAFQNKVGTTWRIEVRQRPPGTTGEWPLVRAYSSGVDFHGAPGISQCFCLPDGSVLLTTTLGDVNTQGSQDPYEDVIYGAAPAFTPQAAYTYSVSAHDTTARNASQAAVEAAQRAERMANQAKADVKTNGAAVERRINEVAEFAKRTIAGMQPSAAAIEAQLNDASKLAAFVWQKARDASYLHLKARTD